MQIVRDDVKPVTHQEWEAAGRERYGDDKRNWKFRCPACDYVASVAEWFDEGMQKGAGFSCVGRAKMPKCREAFANNGAPGPCNYSGGGIFKLNPVSVLLMDGSTVQMFDFADNPLVKRKCDA